MLLVYIVCSSFILDNFKHQFLCKFLVAHRGVCLSLGMCGYVCVYWFVCLSNIICVCMCIVTACMYTKNYEFMSVYDICVYANMPISFVSWLLFLQLYQLFHHPNSKCFTWAMKIPYSKLFCINCVVVVEILLSTTCKRDCKIINSCLSALY